MRNPLGEYATNYKVKKNQNLIIGENMASFRLALSRVILLYLFPKIAIRSFIWDTLYILFACLG